MTNIGVRLINPLATFVLAGLLTPADFGLVAIAMLILAVIQVIQDFGLGQTLIRWPGDQEQAADVTFVLMLMLSGGLYVVTVLSAPMAAAFFNQPEATLVIQILGLTLITSALGVVPGVLLEKNLDFKKKVIPEILPLLAHIVISVAMAVSGWGVWSIVWARIVQSLLATLLMWRASGWQFKFSFNLPIAGALLSYSQPLFSTSFLTIIFLYIDNGYIGRLLGVEALGYYTFAFNLANLPVTSISFIVNRVSFPSFVKLQHQQQDLTNAFLYSMNMTTLIMMPSLLGKLYYCPASSIISMGTNGMPVLSPFKS